MSYLVCNKTRSGRCGSLSALVLNRLLFALSCHSVQAPIITYIVLRTHKELTDLRTSALAYSCTNHPHLVIDTIFRTLYNLEVLCTLVFSFLLVVLLTGFCPSILDFCCSAFFFLSYSSMFFSSFSSCPNLFLNNLIILILS